MQLTDEYRACAKKFKEHFGYGVPLRMIPQTASTEEVIEKINLCIEKNKDDLLISFGIDETVGILY